MNAEVDRIGNPKKKVLICLEVFVSLWGKKSGDVFQVLENFSDAPMTPKQILHVIQTKGLKEMRLDTLTYTSILELQLTTILIIDYLSIIFWGFIAN